MFECIDYTSDKKELLLKMDSIRSLFTELNKLDIDVSEAIAKIDSTIESVNSDSLSIVLVGAFSDGKTSVISGWLDEELDNMKIDTDESSNEILKYTPSSLPKGCYVVDTPGLFGDKRDENDSQVLLSDITKRYISEANIILYVVNAKTPIKDSHKSCINWLLNELNKVSSIIFVINKMDEVADLTDEDDFNNQAQIKTEYLRTKLLTCGITQEDIDKIKVVCVSAAPDRKGIGEWVGFRDEYLSRSHILNLEEAANEILKNSRQMLIVKTGCDVLRYELNQVLSELSQQDNDIENIVLPEKRESLRRNQKDLAALRKRIQQSRNDIRDELKKLQKSKLTKLRASTIDTFEDFYDEEIGIVADREDCILADDITAIYQRFAEQYSDWSVSLKDKFMAEYTRQDTTIENLIKKSAAGAAVGLKGAGKIRVSQYKSIIKAGQNALGKIGIVIKFKPWQITKMAKFASNTLPVIGAIIEIAADIFENITETYRNKKFEKEKATLKEGINELFADCWEQLKDDDWFFENFAPDVKTLEEQIQSDEEEIMRIENNKTRYAEWTKKAREIEAFLA